MIKLKLKFQSFKNYKPQYRLPTVYLEKIKISNKPSILK